MMRSFATIVTVLGSMLTASAAHADGRSKLTVEIAPGAAQLEGAAWRLKADRPGGWLRSGAVLTAVSDGEHSIEFQDGRDINPAAICIKPADEGIFIRPGVMHHVVATYDCTQAASIRPEETAAISLRIVIVPPAANAGGAAWSIDGGAWQESGAVLSHLDEGDHVVTFRRVATGPCSAAPAQEVLSLHLSGLSTIERHYSGPGC